MKLFGYQVHSVVGRRCVCVCLFECFAQHSSRRTQLLWSTPQCYQRPLFARVGYPHVVQVLCKAKQLDSTSWDSGLFVTISVWFISPVEKCFLKKIMSSASQLLHDVTIHDSFVLFGEMFNFFLPTTTSWAQISNVHLDQHCRHSSDTYRQSKDGFDPALFWWPDDFPDCFDTQSKAQHGFHRARYCSSGGKMPIMHGLYSFGLPRTSTGRKIVCQMGMGRRCLFPSLGSLPLHHRTPTYSTPLWSTSASRPRKSLLLSKTWHVL